MAFPRHFLRRTIFRPITTPRRPTQPFTRRSYASAPSHGADTSSNLPWAVGSISILVPGLYFIEKSRPEKTPHHDDAHHGAHGETEKAAEQQDEAAQTPSSDPVPQPDRDAEQKVTASSSDSSGGSTSAASATGSSSEVPENPGRTTVEVDRGRSDNPYVNEPGKSMKGEGETESVKVKGSVSPERPQA